MYAMYALALRNDSREVLVLLADLWIQANNCLPPRQNGSTILSPEFCSNVTIERHFQPSLRLTKIVRLTEVSVVCRATQEDV